MRTVGRRAVLFPETAGGSGTPGLRPADRDEDEDMKTAGKERRGIMERKGKNQDSAPAWDRWLNALLVFLMIVMTAVMIVRLIRTKAGDHPATVPFLAASLMTMVLSLVLYLCYRAGHYRGAFIQGLLFRLIVFQTFYGAFAYALTWLVYASRGLAGIPVGFVGVGVGLTVVGIHFLCLYDHTFFRIPKEKDRRLRNILHPLCGAMLVLSVTDGWTGLLVRGGEAGQIVPGPGYPLWWAFCVGIFAWYCILIHRYVPKRMTRWALTSGILAHLIWLGIDHLILIVPETRALSFLSPFACFLSLFLIFCLIHIQQSRDLEEKEREAVATRLNALQMQMNPHFMSNALNAVAALTETDPQRARRLISDLSAYLRDNFYDSSEERSLMIPFEEEMEHLERYLSIEQCRFPKIRVEFWLEATRFLLPAMTVQPLVENAIKHGICRRKGSRGTIEISSGETGDAWVITVKDDGVGFRPGEPRKEYGEKHIGLSNTRKRLVLLCDGTLEVRSEPGKGTVCEVRIPKAGRQPSGKKAGEPVS